MTEHLMNPIVDILKIHWVEQDIGEYYGHNNQGYVFGIEFQDDQDNYECVWYKSKKERDKQYKKEIKKIKFCTNFDNLNGRI